MIPQFTIEWNKMLSIIATAGAGLAVYFIQDQVLETIVATLITGALGTMSVKAQTMDPAGTNLKEHTRQGETVYESAKKS